MDLDPTSRKERGAHEGGPPRACPLSRGALVAPLTYLLHPYIPTWPKTSRTHNRSGVAPPEASVATKNQSRPVPAPCRMGQSFSGGHLHHPGALHDEEGVVLRRGWGYVPVAMCLISLSCSWDDTILMYRELCYYIWILWFLFPPLLSCNELSFPFEVILSDWVFKDLRTLDVCLAVDICGDNGTPRATWCMLRWPTCGFMNLCIGVGTRFRRDSPVELWGTLWSTLCWLDESEIVWCISYDHTHRYLRWHWSI